MERGQASLEYVAVAGVLACVLALAGAAAGAERIPRAVAAQVERALCLVASGDCLGDGGPRPCVRSFNARTRETRLGLVVARLTDGRTVVQQQRADGTVAVTVSDSVGADAGPRASIQGVRLAAHVGARFGAGRRWVVPDAAAARRLVERLEHERLPAGEAVRAGARFLLGGGDEDERFAEAGPRGEVAATLGALGLGGRANALAAFTQGIRIERATGHRTLVLRIERDQAAALSASLGRAAGGAERETVVEATFSRGGEPVALAVRRVMAVRGDADVGPFRGRGGSLLEAEGRLDLTDPQARALAGAFLDRARHADPAALELAAQVGRRIADGARLDVRLYATDRDERRVAGRELLGAGFETVELSERARLVLAAGREPGQGWARRLDCKVA